MHRGVNKARIGRMALRIARAIKPIHPQRLDTLLGIIVDVNKFHDPAKIVRLPGRLAHQVHLVWASNQNAAK